VSELLFDTSGPGKVMVAGAISYPKESRMPKSQSGRAAAPPATGGRLRATPYEPFVIESIKDPVIAAVLRGVRDIVGRPVTSTALRALSHMSRRRLEQRFRTILGCSPMQVIRRVNLERAATMLGETSLSVKEIAKHCCFGSGVHLSVAFKKHFGVSPSQVRNQRRRASSLPPNDGRPPRRTG
jgi:transcriptional regulator GlxA family with amidase domain